MRTVNLIFGILLTLWNVGAFACEYAARPDIPSEGAIDERSKLMIQAGTLRYLREVEAYVACIQAEYEAAVSGGAPSSDLSALAASNNETIAEAEAVRDLYERRIGAIEELAELGAVKCIRGGPNAKTTVIDSQNILFYGRDGIYLNILRGKCPQLRRNSSVSFGGFSFTNASRFGQGFCADQLLGGDGNGCKLDEFYPVSDSEAEALLQH